MLEAIDAYRVEVMLLAPRSIDDHVRDADIISRNLECDGRAAEQVVGMTLRLRQIG